MPKVVITHAVVDLDRWLEGKSERAAAIESGTGSNVTDYVAHDGSNNIAITADVQDVDALQGDAGVADARGRRRDGVARRRPAHLGLRRSRVAGRPPGDLAARSTLMHVRSAVHDPDQLLIEQMLAPPPLEDAQRSLEYWQARRKQLPLYQRSARREAKAMAVRWQERVRAAELARFEASSIGRLLAHLGISSIWFRRVQLASQLLSWVFWAVVLRKVKFVLGSFAAAGDRDRGLAPRRDRSADVEHDLCEHMFVRADATILHADVDAFFAAVEQRDRPELRGRPVLVGAGVVLCPSYEAKAHGVQTAMGVRRALRLCPGAVVVRPRMTAYSEASKAVYRVFDDTTPLVEGMSIDEAFLDVRGLRRLSGSPLEIATRLREVVRERVGLPITVGIARTKFLAKVASGVAKPDGLLLVPPYSELEFLHPLPVERLWGVGSVTARRLTKPGSRPFARSPSSPRTRSSRCSVARPDAICTHSRTTATPVRLRLGGDAARWEPSGRSGGDRPPSPRSTRR